MRYFPRGAFTAVPSTPFQASVAQVQLQQAQQLQQQVQQFQQALQFQQQLWQQVEMPVFGPQVATMPPAFLYQAQVQAQPQALALRMDLRSDPLRMDPQFADPAWVQVGMGGFGRPIF